MPLTVARLGPYVIRAAVGAGGMFAHVRLT
jgi:hypothetical protein